MDHYFVLGNPVQHSKSPWIHTRFAELTQHVLTYERQLFALDNFQKSLSDLKKQYPNLKGCNVTTPFKSDAFQCAAQSSERAQLAQAANTLIWMETSQNWFADNTDGCGLVRDIEINTQWKLENNRILLIGAGGAAAGVLAPLLGAKPSQLFIVNRTLHKAQTLVNRHQLCAQENGCELQALALDDSNLLQGKSSHSHFDVIINASTSSLLDAPIPVPQSVLRPNCLTIDLMYGKSADPFLNWAQKHGAKTRDGLGMLVEQAAESFWLWRGVRAPSLLVLNELQSLINAI